jgi:hypothetical protein
VVSLQNTADFLVISSGAGRSLSGIQSRPGKIVAVWR